MSSRGRPRTNKEPKRKAVRLRLCARMNAGRVMEPYTIMEGLIATVRKDLSDIKIGIVWHTGWRPDADGIRTMGKAIKNSETERQRTDIDWDIQISEPVWGALDARGKERLIFHELEHIQIVHDKDGGVMLDDKSRVVTRAMAIDGARGAILFWLDNIKLAGNADARRSLAARRDQMKEQVAEQLQNVIGQQAEEFAEDPAPGSDESDEEL